MEDFNWVPIVVAAIGSGGIGASINAIYNMVKLSRDGVSGREDKRRSDIISERDYAITALQRERIARHLAEDRFDNERENRRRLMEQIIDLRILVRTLSPGHELPEFPDLEDTLPAG